MRAIATTLFITTTILLSACGSDAGGVEGTYALDMTAMKPKLQEMMGQTSEVMEAAKKALAAMPAEVRALAEKKAAEQEAEMLSNFDFEVTLNGDGSFQVLAAKDGEEQAKGTWTLEGTKIMITTTHQNGKQDEKPETLEGKLENGVITFKPDASMPFDLVFRKK